MPLSGGALQGVGARFVHYHRLWNQQCVYGGSPTLLGWKTPAPRPTPWSCSGVDGQLRQVPLVRWESWTGIQSCLNWPN